jgi:predicted  nucleic acid-binding Zn-ribbon protein
MSASLGLFRLQQVDRQIDRVQAQLDAIRKTLENDVELRSAMDRVETEEKQSYRLRHDLKLIEVEAESQQIKIQQAESSLYGGNVHNPKELQDLQNDVASLKRHLTTLEDRELQAMDKVEKAESNLQAAKTDLEGLQSRLGDQHKKLLDDQAALMKDLERLASEREAALAPIESHLLEVYEGLRQQRRGVAVTGISDNSCDSCGSRLTAAIQQNARSTTQIVHCPSCGRILYAG